MFILLFFAFLAGFVTTLSPCVLPVLPLLLAAGIRQGRARSFGIVVGLVLSFAFFTLFLTTLVSLTGVSPDFLRWCAIILIFFFGLSMIFPTFGNWFAQITSGIGKLGSAVQEKSALAGAGFWSGFILGVALGLIWTPCAGPILAAITTLVATSAVSWSAVFVTFAYSIGTAIPMFLIMYGGNKIVSSTQILSQYSELIRKIFGVLMVLGALAIALHVDVVLQQVAVKYFPVFVVENNKTVQKELEKLVKNKNPQFSFEGNSMPKAPEFIGITAWLNSPPLTIEQLKGKVVLVDFWTYSCINCVRTLPHLKKLYDTYKDKGFVLVGIHTPEFEFEKSAENVARAVKDFGITYPVGLDSNYATWQNYNNRYWPAHYLVDQQGRVVHTHFGEGAYAETENEVRKLFGFTPLAEKTQAEEQTVQRITPETYLGYERAAYYSPEISLKEDQVAQYNYTSALQQNQVGLKGSWFVAAQYIEAQGNSQLDLHFIATYVYLVAQSPEPQLITVLLDGKPLPEKYWTSDMNAQGQLRVGEPKMYHVVDLKEDYGAHILTLKVPDDVAPYVFTFG